MDGSTASKILRRDHQLVLSTEEYGLSGLIGRQY